MAVIGDRSAGTEPDGFVGWADRARSTNRDHMNFAPTDVSADKVNAHLVECPMQFGPVQRSNDFIGTVVSAVSSMGPGATMNVHS